MNLLIIVVVAIAAVVAAVLAFRCGVARGRRENREIQRRAAISGPEPDGTGDAVEGKSEGKRGTSAFSRISEPSRMAGLAAERHRLFGELADARAETARYRQIIVDLEENTPPPLLDAPNAPDDLKLIVGIGPVLERMLQQLGVFTYRQIAHWSERDVDAFDAKLPEFPGRIRRDAWVTQARALHRSKYGERP